MLPPHHAAAPILRSLSQQLRSTTQPFYYFTQMYNIKQNFSFSSSVPPLQRWSLFIRKEIAGLVGAEEVVLLHLHHVLRLIRFLKLQTVHRRRFR